MASKTIIEEFVAVLGWEVDDDDLKKFDQAVSDLGNDLKWVTGLIAGATAAIGALVVTTNQETSEMANLAESVGITAETFEALAGVVKNMGLESDRVIDLVEEMNNKLGEKKGLGKMTAVEESLKILNLEFKELIKLKPEEQFQKIIDSALELKDVQLAVSAVDMLMGGEANKILGFLRSTGSSLEDILERYKALNLLSEEGREGAKQFTMIWGQFTGVLDSIIKLFSGLVGREIAPMINEFLDFVIANKELIQIKVKEWVRGFIGVLQTMWRLIRTVVGFLQPFIDRLGGLKNTFKLLGLAIASVKIAKFLAAVKGLAVLAKFKAGLAAFASPVTLLAGLLVILGLAIEDLYVYFQGGDSLLGKWGETIAEFVDVHIAGFIASLLGLSREEFNMAFIDTIDNVIKALTVSFPEALAEAYLSANDFLLKLFDDNVSYSEKFQLVWGALKTFVIAWFESLGEVAGFFFTKLDEYFPGLTDTIIEFAAGVQSVFTGIADTIVNAFNRAVGAVGGLVDKGRGFLQGLPFVGALFDETGAKGALSPLVGAGLGPSQTQGALRPSSGVVNQTSNQTSSQAKTEVHNEINVTQLPGENSQDLARRITDTMQAEVAAAVRNNETGVVY